MAIKKRIYRCPKCGRRVTTARRLRRCPYMEIVPASSFRKPTYSCGGYLERVTAAKRKAKDAAGKLAHAQAAVKRNLAKLKRTSTAIRAWQRKVAYYEKQIIQESTQKVEHQIRQSIGRRAITLEN